MAYKKIEDYDEDVTEGLMKSYQKHDQINWRKSGQGRLLKTPERVAKAMQYCTQGYNGC